MIDYIKMNIFIGVVIAIGISFSAGYYKGKNSEAIKYTIQTQKSEIINLENKIKSENDIIMSMQNKANELQSKINIMEGNYHNAQEQIRKDKEYIDSHNVIRDSFVRYIQYPEANMPTYAPIAEQPIESDKPVSADKVLSFITALQKHDTDCVMKYNTLLNVYNDEMSIINK